jgi:hypothetical protein
MIDQYMIAFLTNGASDTGRGSERCLLTTGSEAARPAAAGGD